MSWLTAILDRLKPTPKPPPAPPNPPGRVRTLILTLVSDRPLSRREIVAGLASHGSRPNDRDLATLLAAMANQGLIAFRRGDGSYSITAKGLNELDSVVPPRPPIPPGPPVPPVPPPGPPPVPPPQPPVPPLPPVPPSPDVIPPIAAELIGLHNARRSLVNAPPLSWDARLQRAAQVQADDQARRRRMGHDGSDGSDVAVRVARQDYGWRSLGENVAYGQADAAAVMGAWTNSAGHRRNIENKAYVHFGGAMARDVGGAAVWATVFAAPGSMRAPSPSSSSSASPSPLPPPDCPEW